MRAALCLLVMTTLIAPPAHSQASELQPGARVRLEAPGIVAPGFTGVILNRSADSLMVGAATTMPVTVPRVAITSLEVSRGKSRSLGAIEGVKWGVPIFALLGVALAPGLRDCSVAGCKDASSSEKTSFVLAGTLSGALWGAGIGALIGRERWERFSVPLR